MEFELVASILAMFIALCALVVSIWQGMETRKNYRLSVTPHLKMEDNFVPGAEMVGICISNKGIGPAILEKMTIRFLGKEYDYISDFKIFFLDFMKAMKVKNLEDFTFQILTEGIFIAPREDLPIICLRNPNNEEEALLFFQALFGLSISIDYKSIYGESFVLNFKFGEFVA